MSEEKAMTTVEAIKTVLEHAGVRCDAVVDLQLLEWSKSTSKDGPKIKFMLTDDEALVPFETATVSKGRQAGQLYAAFFVRLDMPDGLQDGTAAAVKGSGLGGDTGAAEKTALLPVLDENHVWVTNGKELKALSFDDDLPEGFQLVEPDEAEKIHARLEHEKKKAAEPGPLCKLAAQWCKESKFWAWCETVWDAKIRDEVSASELVRSVCQIESRKQLDSKPASDVFNKEFRLPYTQALKKQSR